MHIRPLSAGDIPFALALCRQNHWNQLAGDWQRQLGLEPAGSFLAECGGQPAGTACYTAFADIAWISLVLVDRFRRRQGIGTALLRHVISVLDALGMASIRLDATPLGRPVYEKLGFQSEFALARMVGTLGMVEKPADVRPMDAGDLPEICRLDQAVTGTRRDRLLRLLFEGDPTSLRVFAPAGRIEGFLLARPGANAWQLGPVQGSPRAAHALLRDAAHRLAGQRVYLDVPIDHAAAVALAQSLCLVEERRFLRMRRGRPIAEDLERYWSAFGPEKG